MDVVGVAAIGLVLLVALAVMITVRRRGWLPPDVPADAAPPPNRAWLPPTLAMIPIGIVTAISNDRPLGRIGGLTAVAAGLLMAMTGELAYRRARR